MAEILKPVQRALACNSLSWAADIQVALFIKIPERDTESKVGAVALLLSKKTGSRAGVTRQPIYFN